EDGVLAGTEDAEVRLGVADVDDEEHRRKPYPPAHPMKLKLYIVHGSHPCAAVAKALQMKGLPYATVEWPPPMHAVMQRILFDTRTVPALRVDGSEKVQGSRAIMHRLDELAPAPALYPADPARRAAVEEADEWGDRVLQPVARELIWVGFLATPAAMVSYTEHSKLPLPAAAVKLSAPLIARAQAKLNSTDPAIAVRV